MTNDQKYIEIGKAHGFCTVTETSEYLAFVSALQKQMISEGWRQCAKGQGNTQFCAVAEAVRKQERERKASLVDAASTAVLCLHELGAGVVDGLEWEKVASDLSRALVGHKKDTDAFIAEVQANALEAHLPFTADGKPIYPDMQVFCVVGDYIDERKVLGPYGKKALLTFEPARHGFCSGSCHRLANTVYSTREAAELRQSAAQPESGRMCNCVDCAPSGADCGCHQGPEKCHYCKIVGLQEQVDQEQKKVAMLHDAALSATKQDTEAFIAEVEAKAREKALDDAILRLEMTDWPPTKASAEILRKMRAELRQSAAQPESGRMCSCIECVPDAEQPERKEGGE